MRIRKRTLIALSIFIIVTAVALFPSSAHALNLFDFGGVSATQMILALVSYALEGAQKAISAFVLWLTDIVVSIVNTPYLNYGGTSVYLVWKIFRDLCNSFFIVFFILIAFSTVFHSILKSAGVWYYRTALVRVIVAAILVNFSLPIGQTIVWAGNQASTAVIGLMASTDVKATLTTALQLEDRRLNKPFSYGRTLVPDQTTPLNQKDSTSQITTQWSEKAKAEFEKCVKGEVKPVNGSCAAIAIAIDADKNKQALDEKAAVKAAPASATSYIRALTPVIATTPGVGIFAAAGTLLSTYVYDYYASVGNSRYKMESTQLLALIGLTLGNILLLTLTSISMLCVVAFMVLRLPMIWLLLMTSAIACFMYAVPQSKRFQTWWGDMIGYNIFAPLYLFVLYIGFLIMSKQVTLLDGLQNASWLEGMLGSFLFTGVAVAVFVGGAKAAWDIAFGFSTNLKDRVTKYAGAVGVSEKSMFGLSGIKRVTGISALQGMGTAALGGAGANITRRYEKAFTEPQKAREAKLRAMFEGGAAAEILRKKNLSEAIKKTEESGASIEELRGRLGKNTPESLAAYKLLLDKGELTPKEAADYITNAAGVSPSYQQAVRESVGRKLREQVKGKELRSVVEIEKALEAVSGDKTAFRRLLDSVAETQPLLYAQLDKSTRLVRDGKEQTTSEALDSLASKLSDKELVQIMTEGVGGQRFEDLGENLQYIANSKLSDPKDRRALMREAKTDKNREILDMQLARIESVTRTKDIRREQEQRAPEMAAATVQELTERIKDLTRRRDEARDAATIAGRVYDFDNLNTSAKELRDTKALEARRYADQIQAIQNSLNRGSPPSTP